MNSLTANMHYFARWLVMFSDGVRVESPADLKTLLLDHVQKCLAHHQSY